VIRGIPKEGWKPRQGKARVEIRQCLVVIRGIPKEGWKLGFRVSPSLSHKPVVIRGIPKEGWKRGLKGKRP
jgi:hypothetical protein